MKWECHREHSRREKHGGMGMSTGASTFPSTTSYEKFLSRHPLNLEGCSGIWVMMKDTGMHVLKDLDSEVRYGRYVEALVMPACFPFLPPVFEYIMITMA